MGVPWVSHGGTMGESWGRYERVKSVIVVTSLWLLMSCAAQKWNAASATCWPSLSVATTYDSSKGHREMYLNLGAGSETDYRAWHEEAKKTAAVVRRGGVEPGTAPSKGQKLTVRCGGAMVTVDSALSTALSTPPMPRIRV